jgi:hypothetical protein
MHGRAYSTIEDLAATVKRDHLALLVAEVEDMKKKNFLPPVLVTRYGLTSTEREEFWTWVIAMEMRDHGFKIDRWSESLLLSWQTAGTLDSKVAAWRDDVVDREVSEREREVKVEQGRRRRAGQAAARVAMLFPSDPTLAESVKSGSVSEVEAMSRYPVTVDDLVTAFDLVGGHQSDWNALPDGFRVDWIACTGLVGVFCDGVPVAAWDHLHHQVPVPEVENINTLVVGPVEPYDDQGAADRFAALHPGAPVDVIEGLRSGLYSEGQALILLVEGE